MPSRWNAKFARDRPPRSPFSTPFQPKIPEHSHPGQPNEAFEIPIHKAIRSLHPGVALLVCLLAGMLLDRLLPGDPWPFTVRVGAGAPLLTLALFLAAWGILTLRGARTPIEPGKIPSCLVVSGPYRFTRNPLYLAQLLFLTGLGFLVFRWLLPIAVLQGFLLDRLVIRGEEQRLAEAFGEDFQTYRNRVRRWV